MTPTISVCMIVRNEAHRIVDALENVRPWVDEIVMIDQASEDNTVELAKPYVDVIMHETAKGEAETDRPKAAEASHGDWILIQDADEIWTPRFFDELPLLVARPDMDCYRILRRTQVVGYPAFDEHHMRLHRRGKAEYPLHLHTAPRPLGPTQELDFVCMYHLKTVEEQRLDEEGYEAKIDAEYQGDFAYENMKRLNFVTHPERGFWQVRRAVAEAVQP